MSAQPQVIDLMEALKTSLARRQPRTTPELAEATAPLAAALAPTREAPVAGVHRMPYERYANVDAVRHSVLAEVARSPAHARAAELGLNDTDSKATVLGEATHTMVLEPALFSQRFAVRPVDYQTGEPLNLTLKAGKEWKASLPPGVKVLDKGDPERACGMAAALGTHPIASALLFGTAGLNEAVLVWEEDGLFCKRRLDRFAPVVLPDWRGTALVELKTTLDARPWKFSSDAERFGYFGAGAWSLRGAEALGGRGAARRYFIVAVESQPPHAVQVYEPNADDIAACQDENDRLLAIYRECKAKDEWPAYPVLINELRRPRYARHSEEE